MYYMKIYIDIAGIYLEGIYFESIVWESVFWEVQEIWLLKKFILK